MPQITAEAGTTSSTSDISWTHLSSEYGDLPVPSVSTQQTSALIVDLDEDDINDFVIAARRNPGPALIWYRRLNDGWDRYVIDDSSMRIEAGGTYTDIDDDGDLDIVMGGDSGVNQIWWWENPYPNFNPNANWTRRLIKNSGDTKHHDQIFGDFDDDERDELVYWNQAAKKLFLAEIPADPRSSGTWPATAIYTWSYQDEHEGLAKADIDGDGLDDVVGGGRWFKYNGGTDFTANIIDNDQTFTRAAAGQLKEGGRPEVVFVVGDGIGPLKWYEWDGSSWIGHELLNHDVDHGHSLQVKDINGDGHQDIFVGEMRVDSENPDATIWIFYGDGQGNFTTSIVSTGIGSHESKVGDLDGDGDIDILGKPYNWDTPRVDIWLSDLACIPSLDTWERHVIDSDKPWRAVLIESADLDGDSFEDVITGGWWYKNPGTPGSTWVRNDIGSPLSNMATVYDFDGDGDLDILGTEGQGSEANPNFVWARNNGSGSFTILNNIDPGVGDFLQGVAAASFGGANQEVALSWHRSGRGVQALSIPNDPSNQTWAWREISTSTQQEDLSQGDIDRDGDLDLLLGTQWLRNNTDGNPDWGDGARRYRLPFSIEANGYEREDKPAEITVNFTTLLSNLGQNGVLDLNSLRVFEVIESGQIVDNAVPFQFDPFSDFNASSNAAGNLIIILEDQTLENAERRYQLYFDTEDNGPFTPVVIPDRVTTTDGVQDAGQESIRVETGEGTYFYHKDGGGFSSLDDAQGNDWINHSTATGSEGLYRGIPNMVHPNDGGYFHPGPGSIVSDLTAQGPLKTTIFSKTPDDLWEVKWEIYAQYAQMTVLKADANYWFLYEGTPGGDLDFDADLVVRSDGTETTASESWTGAVEPEEWLFFADPNIGRSLYLVHHENDDLVDSYWLMNNLMTVLGFGRDANARHLSGSHHFTMGLTDNVDHAAVGQQVNNAYQPLTISLGAAESSGLPQNSGPWQSFTLSNNSGDPDRNELADVNDDGRLDAIVGYEAISNPGLLAWYEAPANATNLWTEHEIGTVTGPMSVDVADMDGDGDQDVVVGEHNTKNPETAKLYVFENLDGQGESWARHEVFLGDEHHDGAQTVDIDNDGDLDIISIGWTHGRVVVYENKSACSGTPPPQATATPTASTPTATSSAQTATSEAPTATSSAPTATPTDSDPSSCDPSPGNLLVNPGFESGTADWTFSTRGTAGFATSGPAFQCTAAARININKTGKATQLFQTGFLLKENAQYRLSFAAFSSTGNDLEVDLHKHKKPYTMYGLDGEVFDLSQGWQTFSTEFTASGFSGATNDTRFRFWFSGHSANGDVYWIDDVMLEEINGSATDTPQPTAIQTATPQFTSTPTQTAGYTSTPTATAEATDTPVPPTATNTAEPGPTYTPTATQTPTATSTPDDPNSCTPDPANVLSNPGFESGSSDWLFYANSQAEFEVSSPAYQCEKAARITFNSTGSNMQLYQKSFVLKANTTYQLSFAASSSSGNNLKVYLHKHGKPYTNYGINGELFDLAQDWQTYSTEFTTTNFTGTTDDTRLRFWFVNLAKSGDVYQIDDVVLEEIGLASTTSLDNSEGSVILELVSEVWRALLTE